MFRRRTAALTAPLLALSATLVAAAPAQAVPADKPQVLTRWTQTGPTSYTQWATARVHRAKWSAYGFDWSTDYCSSSPDNPFGFPFRMSCAHHDFGYRNHKAAGTFAANKPRLDTMLHADLRRVCTRYTGAKKKSCSALAWTYYEAVKRFGH
ncbi:phospholipase [Streptomyces sp. NBC_01525]|uniref:phospholipase n=1 Tax=Streptomyces sp. NBC_01525 TaxID=2903893 RepID=UPI00386B44AB